MTRLSKALPQFSDRLSFLVSISSLRESEYEQQSEWARTIFERTMAREQAMGPQTQELRVQDCKLQLLHKLIAERRNIEVEAKMNETQAEPNPHPVEQDELLMGTVEAGTLAKQNQASQKLQRQLKKLDKIDQQRQQHQDHQQHKQKQHRRQQPKEPGTPSYAKIASKISRCQFRTTDVKAA
ncbi:hypothetical protein BDB00DRAFT_438807 [Zychaea mexicana]|uniref:uncharacterized protein n=1 Tax=Zychaea mexicana TaxID=64656 RepID=UPI0022FEC08B|nr:uncharacterized protein BDB00DRAFT_438807 [Zychaea mexicana]KAI9492409.1 hypothetical protein BDB00DRAFT_438807 [Zychaea mexicana]